MCWNLSANMVPGLHMSKSISMTGQRKPQKRKRTVLSCTECHRRKQKCDRQYPCCNCIKRETQNLCRYDAEPKGCQGMRSDSSEGGPPETSCGANMVHNCQPAELNTEGSGELQDKIRGFGYSSYGNHNSLNLLRATERYGGQDLSFIGSSVTNQPIYRSDADRKYKGLVRQLPSQTCIDTLVQTFFSDINWQYDLLDEDCFREDLGAWRKISYAELQSGLGRLTRQTLVFPALLFQVLAQALLFHPPHDEIINSLMSMADMTFHDLGAEYSDLGAELLGVLGKEDITIATVQAGLLRASFLKSSGKVVESWHALGAAIRDAQEIGLHTGRIVSEPSKTRPKRESPNARFVGHKIWVVLHIWDVHMAVVLGRPIATDIQIDRFAHTIEDDEKRRELFLHWQSETDSPRPFDIILAGYNVAYQYFKEIHEMEHNGTKPQDYSMVEHIHAAIKKNIELMPSWSRLEAPDTKFDRIHGCQWLPVAREGLASLIHLVLLVLHRPYIFSVANSRTEALKAGISILRAQELLFQQLEPHQCKVFNPVYASFDAIVIIAALCLVFPNENHELRAECISVIERGMQRLGIIGQYNSMAKSAHGVVYSLYYRLRQRLGISETAEDVRAFSNLPERSLPNFDSNFPYGAPSEIPINAVSPPRPTHDLFIDHISSPQIPITDTSYSLSLDSLPADLTDGWNFEGTFSDASFWSWMNQLNH